MLNVESSSQCSDGDLGRLHSHQSALHILHFDTLTLKQEELAILLLAVHLSKRNLAVRQSTGTVKNPSVWGEWMSTVITCRTGAG